MADIIEILNDVLSAELTAINQYFLHAKLCQNWGFHRLAKHIRAESIDEMKHADILIDRILYLKGVPNVQRLYRVRVGESVKEQFECDLALENEAIPRLAEGVRVCTEQGDVGTRILLETILASEELHKDWLEEQLELISQVGIQGYLAEQIRP